MDFAVFQVDFRGDMVECDSLADAQAVLIARDILDNPAVTETSPDALDRLAEVLTRYDRHSAADQLSAAARRIRARLFLLH